MGPAPKTVGQPQNIFDFVESCAFKHGEPEDPLAMYLNDVFTVPANLSGNPGISVPCGYSSSGLPIGLHLVGRAFDEATLLRVAHAYEQATPWRQRRPELA